MSILTNGNILTITEQVYNFFLLLYINTGIKMLNLYAKVFF
jgi:hypothetical protein